MVIYANFSGICDNFAGDDFYQMRNVVKITNILKKARRVMYVEREGYCVVREWAQP
ncbi:hypothetical protein GCM10007086_06970 [Photobacterium aphoticum]|nr:hypothetical protein GCM10007086_06970 [Photobacterium aphoticum]